MKNEEELGYSSRKPGTRNPEPGTRNPEPGTQVFFILHSSFFILNSSGFDQSGSIASQVAVGGLSDHIDINADLSQAIHLNIGQAGLE